MRRSAYSVRAHGEPYAVSRAATPAGERFSAWHGPSIKDGGHGYFPELLGVFDSADAAKAACVSHPAEAAID